MRFLFIFFFIIFLLPGSYSLATEYTFEIAWTIEEPVDVLIDGYRLYESSDIAHNNILCTAPADATTMECTVNITGNEATFVLVSYSTDGVESDPSDPFTIIFEPVLEAAINFTTTEGSLTVFFDASNSINPDNSTLTYRWNFGDGTTATTVQATHEYTSGGTYNVSLTIWDSSGDEATATRELVLTEPSTENQAPTARLNVLPIYGEAPLTVTLDASESSDPENSTLTCFWEFGDGTTAIGPLVLSHQYITAGTYTAKVTVTDDQGLSASTISQPIMVLVSEENPADTSPTASILATSTSNIAPATVSFSGASSSPSEPTGSIISYAWTFGDGTTGSGQSVQHTYTIPGTYTVQLTVTDNSGKQATATQYVNIYSSEQQKNPSLIHIYKLLLLKD